MVTVTNLARFNLSALPETERRAVAGVIEVLHKDGSNALGRFNASKAQGYKDTYVIRTYGGTRIIAEIKSDNRNLEVTDVYPSPVSDQHPAITKTKRLEKLSRRKVRPEASAEGSK